MKNPRFFVALLLVMVVALQGCDTNHDTSDDNDDESAEHTVTATEWPETSFVCEALSLLPDGTLIDSDVTEDDEMCVYTASYSGLPLYTLLKWVAALEDEGWYLLWNGAYCGQYSIDMVYDSRTGKLTLTVTQDKTRAVWPEPIPADFDYVFPYFTYSELKSITEVKMDGYDLVFDCRFEPSDGAALESYMAELVDAGFNDLGYGGGTYVFEYGTASINITPDEDEWQLMLYRYTIYPVPLPPWPDELPEEYAAVLPLLWGNASIATEGGGYRITVPTVSLTMLSDWYASLPGHGWAKIWPDGAASNTGAGLAISSVAYDTLSETFTLFIAPPGVEATEPPVSATASVMPTQAPSATPIVGVHGMVEYDGWAYTLTSSMCSADMVDEWVKTEFGQNAEVADWTELKARFSGDIMGFLDGIGLDHEDVWVNYDGAAYLGAQHFYLAYIVGDFRNDFTIHDVWGENICWLGAIDQMYFRVLVKLPRDEYYDHDEGA